MSARHRRKKRLAVPGWHSIAGDRFKAAPGSGAQVKSGRSMNGHFYSKLFIEVRTLDRLTLYEAPRHTKRTEGRAQQHHGRSTIGDARTTTIGSETGSECAVCSVGRGRC